MALFHAVTQRSRLLHFMALPSCYVASNVTATGEGRIGGGMYVPDCISPEATPTSPWSEVSHSPKLILREAGKQSPLMSQEKDTMYLFPCLHSKSQHSFPHTPPSVLSLVLFVHSSIRPKPFIVHWYYPGTVLIPEVTVMSKKDTVSTLMKLTVQGPFPSSLPPKPSYLSSSLACWEDQLS